MPRRYDQHFLRDENIARAIAEAAQPHPDETLLEIGPGLGILSQYLLRYSNPLIGIEIDPRFHEKLVENYPGATWIRGDALETPWPEKPLYLVSNLPYSISGPFLMRILEHRMWIRGGVLMLQKGGGPAPVRSARGAVNLDVCRHSFRWCIRWNGCGMYDPGSFSPPPKVVSAVIRFVAGNPAMEEWPAFATIVRAAFRQPRQTLGRNLRSANLPCPPHLASLRPHQIPLDELIALWRWLSDLSKS
jgi:16S rRNA (adenine1518-N6/adenine1519-N6)-dimethyltransferase